MENCRLKVLESDEALKFEMAVNACLRYLERAGCAYEVSASVDGYFYKAVIKHNAPGVPPEVDPADDDVCLKRFNHCCYCVYYKRDRGLCLVYDKSVKFAGNACEHFKIGKGA